MKANTINIETGSKIMEYIMKGFDVEMATFYANLDISVAIPTPELTGAELNHVEKNWLSGYSEEIVIKHHKFNDFKTAYLFYTDIEGEKNYTVTIETDRAWSKDFTTNKKYAENYYNKVIAS